MSRDPVYAVVNYHTKHTPGQTTSVEAETTADDATYSNIHMPVSGRPGQHERDKAAGRHCVIYSKVSLPNQDDARPTSARDPDDPAARPTSARDPDDPAPITASAERFQWRVFLKPTVWLLFLSALLLLVVFTLGVLYASSERSHTERLHALQKNNTEIHKQLVQLESVLNSSSEEKTQLWHQLNSSSEEKTQLRHQLNKTQMNLTELQRSYTALTEEKADIQTKLDHLQIEEGKKSADGWEYFSGKWYYFSTDKKTWTESRDACVTKGGHLVIVESEEEQQYINTHSGDYWIGLKRTMDYGSWHWVDNKQLTGPGYWSYDEYRNYGCVRTGYTGTQELKNWKYSWCDSHQRSVCECKAVV